MFASALLAAFVSMTTTSSAQTATGQITGAHGMNKEELIAAIREAKGEEAPKGTEKPVSMRDLKAKVHELQAQRVELAHAGERKKAGIVRRKMSRLKRQTKG
jgi:hypothetical protein